MSSYARTYGQIVFPFFEISSSALTTLTSREIGRSTFPERYLNTACDLDSGSRNFSILPRAGSGFDLPEFDDKSVIKQMSPICSADSVAILLLEYSLLA